MATATKITRVTVPATNRADAVTVEVDANGQVTFDGDPIGTVWKGEYSYSPKAAGHSRVVRYHASVDEWCATGPEKGYTYTGGTFPSHYRKNTRKAALAYLVALALGADNPAYFTWKR